MADTYESLYDDFFNPGRRITVEDAEKRVDAGLWVANASYCFRNVKRAGELKGESALLGTDGSRNTFKTRIRSKITAEVLRNGLSKFPCPVFGSWYVFDPEEWKHCEELNMRDNKAVPF